MCSYAWLSSDMAVQGTGGRALTMQPAQSGLQLQVPSQLNTNQVGKQTVGYSLKCSYPMTDATGGPAEAMAKDRASRNRLRGWRHREAEVFTVTIPQGALRLDWCIEWMTAKQDIQMRLKASLEQYAEWCVYSMRQQEITHFGHCS